MRKILFFDLETTGVKFWKNGIHQIGGIVDIDGEEAERFDIRVAPNPQAVIEKEALDVAGVTLEQVQSYMPMREGYDKLMGILTRYVNRYDKKDKFYLAGYNNASFDNAFLRAFFVQNGDDYFYSWFWVNSIDVMVLATRHLMRQRHEMPDFKQETVAKALGIPIEAEKLHDASYDIRLTRAIYERVAGEK